MRAPFAPSFLAGEPNAVALLTDGFRRPSAWRIEAEARKDFRTAPEVLQALRAFGPEGQRNLAALAERGTVCVVTGQQAGLFLGPLYTFYKALTAIGWARAVERETGARCVPVFWLQSEDHDYKEIASCTAAPGLSLSLPLDEESCSVEHRTLPDEVSGLVARLEEALAPLPFASEIVPLVREAYVPGRSPVAAFAELLGRVFAEEGLLVFNPRCAQIARLSAPLYDVALRRCEEVEAALIRRGELLEGAGFAEQVQVRKGSPLVFFHGAAADGPRHRVRIDKRDELLEAAARDPLRLSSSALLRPIVQDSILPSVAYVGGPAELGYLAQCAELYPIFGVRPSLPVPRARFRIVDARTRAILRELGLSPAEVEAPREEILRKLGSRSANPSLQELLLGDLPRILADSAARHPSLERAARRTRASVERATAKFVSRHARLLASEDETTASRLDRVQAALYPNGTPQERVDSLPYHAARHGLSQLKRLALDRIQPGTSGTEAARSRVALVEDLHP
ncbi:MAG TPA: bacillithiol biosynthesis cysteine-adding enzyme BshC [Myxococcales bacterium]|jgi:bacillithiol biosynthesis cysteine-adding enzyme BshC